MRACSCVREKSKRLSCSSLVATVFPLRLSITIQSPCETDFLGEAASSRNRQATAATCTASRLKFGFCKKYSVTRASISGSAIAVTPARNASRSKARSLPSSDFACLRIMREECDNDSAKRLPVWRKNRNPPELLCPQFPKARLQRLCLRYELFRIRLFELRDVVYFPADRRHFGKMPAFHQGPIGFATNQSRQE